MIIILEDLPLRARQGSRSFCSADPTPGHIPRHGVDPWVVVTAIESVHDKFFSAAGVSGYEYLDKIVNIPF